MKQMIDMKDLMHINLFERVTRVSTKYCFSYNGVLIYAIPREFVSRAIGQGGNNIRELSRILNNRKIKVIGLPENKDSREQVHSFISEIIKPTTFKSLELTPSEIIITGSSRDSRAALIGRNKVRLEELSLIIKEFFGKALKIM